jgi:endonuclease/exonuclease/phosphatase family metal-dependent hydrolase
MIRTMKTSQFICLLLVTMVCLSCNKRLLTKKTQTELRIMSYNIHHANPPSKPDSIDMEAIANTIAKAKPDLVALQEVDVNTKRSGNIDQAYWLAKRLKMNVFFAKAIDHDGGDYGLAILSRFPIVDQIIVRLPTKQITKGEPRILATVVVQLPNNQNIKFGCIHLDAQKEETNRLLQAEALLAQGKSEKLPFILAGDWNARPGSKTIEIMNGAFTRTCQDCAYTIPVTNPKSTIDFISYASQHPFQIISHEVIPERYASDHLPILSVLKLMK